MEKFNEKQKKLLKQCKYYKGEEKCPSGVGFFYWEAEQLYVLDNASWPEAEKSFNDAFASIDVEGVENSLLSFLYAEYEHIQYHNGMEPDGVGFSRFLEGYIEGSTSI